MAWQVATLLTAENTSFSHSPYKALPDGVVVAGKDLGLVAIMQVRSLWCNYKALEPGLCH